MIRLIVLLSGVLLPTCFVSLLHAVIINVPADSTTIQGGINGAANGDTVMVSPGNYNEWDINFQGKAIVVMSEDPLDTAVVATTIVDAGNMGRVFNFENNETSAAVLTGFTIRRGSAGYGAGIRCWGASPTISRNIVTHNMADFGGSGIYLNNSDAIVSQNVITQNGVILGIQEGGGILHYAGIPQILNNLISENRAVRGAGMYLAASDAVLTGNTIVNNLATYGGGLFCTNRTFILITNSILWDNHADSGEEIFLNGEEWYTNGVTIRYSDVRGGPLGYIHKWELDAVYWEDGAIDLDPLFVDPAGGNYRLQQDPIQPGANNPCVDTGDPASLVPLGSTRTDGVQDTGVVDIGFHYGLAEGETAPPFALYAFSPLYPDPDESVLFDAGASYDLDGEIVSYEWDWDSDGVYDEITSEPTVTHTFVTIGYLSVTLRVRDDDDETHSVTETFPVFPGTTWVPDHLGIIQEAIEVCEDGDTVMVRPGTYVENINFLGRAITLKSEFGAEYTILDGGQAGSVVTFDSRESSAAVLEGFTITNGASDHGGGVYCYNSSPTIIGNVITGNSAPDGHGGGLYCSKSSSLIANNIVRANSADGNGGGLRVIQSDATIVNNLVADNVAGDLGGGIICTQDEPLLVNNTVTGNTGGGTGGGVYYFMSPPIVSNCIVWGNAPNNFAGSGPVADISYSDIGGGWPGEGNIDVDPLFGDGLYHLRSSSPCVDAGDPTLFDASLPPGHGGTDSDMGAYGGTGNDAWLEAEIDLLLIPGETVTVPRGGNLEFDTLIWNSTANQVTGDRWLSVRLPNENELLIPDDLLNIQNPLTGTIPGNSSFTAAGTLSIPGGVATGEYLLIGRIGAYPNTVIDEESFWFHVVE